MLPVPHVCGLVQLPQLAVRAVPQLSAALTLPQFLPSRVQKAALVSGTQAQTLFDWQVCGREQLPQLAVRAVPQLSAALTLPQFFPSRVQKAALVSGTQAQTLFDWQVC